MRYLNAKPIACLTAAFACISCYMVDLAQAEVEELGGSCSTKIVRDYERPLRKLPADRNPTSGKLPFAPSGISLSTLIPQNTALRGGEIGYRVETTRAITPDERLKHPVTLRWDMRMRLSSVDRRGRPKELVASKHERVEKMRYSSGTELFLRAKPGIYRFDMTISKWNGQFLKSYHQYVRVLPRRVRLRIALARRAFEGGELVVGRLENLGTLPSFLVSLPYLRVERLDGEWRSLPSKSPHIPVVGSEGILQDGHAGFCKRVFIPSNDTEASYRFSAVVESGGRRMTLTKEFLG